MSRPEAADSAAPKKPMVKRVFCEALELMSALRMSSPDDFEGLEWCLSDGDSNAPVGRVVRGLWQDLDGAKHGEVLLHGLPPGRSLLVRILERRSVPTDIVPSTWVRTSTKPLPAETGGHRCYDLLGRERGGLAGICSGWVLMDAQDSPAISAGGLMQAARCLRCGDVAEKHLLCDSAHQQGAERPTVHPADAEQYIVVIKPCVAAFADPDISSPVLRVFHHGEYVWLFDWDVGGKWRRCLCEGDLENPLKLGWVMVTTVKYGPMLRPQNERKLQHLCQADPHGAMASLVSELEEERSAYHEEKELMSEINSRIHNNHLAWRSRTLSSASYVRRPTRKLRLDTSDGRLLLGLTARPQRTGRCFSKVLVMGAHHTCTTALCHELVQQFKVEVVNDYNGIISPELRPENYKHRVLRAAPDPQDALIVCLVKDPFFWLQSLSRHGAIYAVKPVKLDKASGEFQDRDLNLNAGLCDLAQEKLLDLLLDHVEFLGDVYEDGALGVWEATVRSYFDHTVYPLERTAVVRSEDFLFRFAAVMEALGECGLRRRGDAPPPTQRALKDGIMHPHTRGRLEAQSWYSKEENRFVGLKPRHTSVISERLGPELLHPLGYGKGAAAGWVLEACSQELEPLAEEEVVAPSLWVIVGGADKGGVLVREGPGLSSRKAVERLSTGAIVQELDRLDSDVAGERLRYRKVRGNGPEQGWISVALNHKILAERICEG